MASTVAERLVDVDVAVNPPIFVFDAGGNDVAVFLTLGDAERFIEPPDVSNAEVFDSTGRQLDAKVTGRHVTLMLRASQPNEHALSARVAAFLSAIQADSGLATLTWPEFIAEASRRILDWQHARRR